MYKMIQNQLPSILKRFEYDLNRRSTSFDLPYLASNDLAAASRALNCGFGDGGDREDQSDFWRIGPGRFWPRPASGG